MRTTTATLALWEELVIGSFTCEHKNLHASHPEDWYQQNPDFEGHVEIPDDEDRKNGKSKVANNRYSTVKESKGDDDVDVDAGAFNGFVPEEFDRCALKQSDEEEN